MSCRSLPARLSAVAAGVAVSAVLAGAGVGAPATASPTDTARATAATAATAATTAAGAAPDDAPLAVTIDRMSPGSLPERGAIVIEGTVTNTSHETWSDISLMPFAGADPLTTAGELAVAAESDPSSVVGERITDVLDDVDELLPAERAGYRLRVPRRLLPMTEPGVYWFGVHALGTSESGRDAVADGRARTFLPNLPQSADAVQTAVAVPLRTRIDHTQRGAVARSNVWQRWMSAGGRLRDAVEFGDAAGSRPMSWVLDPAVPDAAQQLADRNLTRSVEPTVPTDGEDDEDGEEPAESATAEEDTGEAGEDPPAAPDPTAVTAREWLADALAALRGDEVLALPYGDVDVSAAGKHAPELYGLARERPGRVLSRWELTTRPLVTSPSGYIDEAGLAAIDDDALVLATDRMFTTDDFPDGAPAVARIEGQPVGVTSYGAAQGGPGPDPRRDPVALRQRVLSEAAMRLLASGSSDTSGETPGESPGDGPGGTADGSAGTVTDEPAPLIVVLPSTIDARGAEEFWSGLDEDWVDLTTVSDAVDRTTTTVDPELLRYPARQDRLEIEAEQFALARRVINRGGTLQQVLTLNDSIAGRLTGEALSGVSYSQRVPETPGQLDRTLGWVERRLEAITVNGPPGVTLSSDSGSFVVTLTNNLLQPVTVQLETASQDGTTTAPVDPVDIPPGTRTTVALDVHTVSAGVDNLRIRVTDSTGEPLGDTATVPVRPGQSSIVIWWIIGAGAALLFIAILIRLVRRFRGRHDAPDDTDPDVADTPDAADDPDVPDDPDAAPDPKHTPDADDVPHPNDPATADPAAPTPDDSPDPVEPAP